MEFDGYRFMKGMFAGGILPANMDDLRLLFCIWRMANDLTYADVGRRLGKSGGYPSGFENGYGTIDRPYPSVLLDLLVMMGYPAGEARGIVCGLYRDQISDPAAYYFRLSEDAALRKTLSDAGAEPDLADRVMGMFRCRYAV